MKRVVPEPIESRLRSELSFCGGARGGTATANELALAAGQREAADEAWLDRRHRFRRHEIVLISR